MFHVSACFISMDIRTLFSIITINAAVNSFILPC